MRLRPELPLQPEFPRPVRLP